MNSTLNVALEVARTEAEGPGIRYALWVQGCPMRCPGCCNPEMLPFIARDRRPVSQVIEAILTADVEGVSFLGGEPFTQAEGLAEVAEAVRARKLTVMIYTGYTLEELEAQAEGDPHVRRLLKATDLLVDGRYEADQRSLDRRWIGSHNQRLHVLSKAYAEDDERFTGQNTIELRLVNGELVLNGWPARGAGTRLVRTQKPGQGGVARLEGPSARAYEVVQALLGATWRLPEKGIVVKQPTALLHESVAELINRRSLQWLTTSGGHQERTVLRRGRRTRGRIWDEALNEGFSLRFTTATEALWLHGSRRLPGMVKQSQQRQRHERGRAIRDWVKVSGTDTGDWLMFARAWEAVGRLPLQTELLRQIRGRLVRGSPLLALATLSGTAEGFAPLTRLPGVRLVECLEPWLIERWLSVLLPPPGRMTYERIGEMVRAHQSFAAWIEALDTASRLDLVRGPMRALAEWHRRLLATEETVIGIAGRLLRGIEVETAAQHREASTRLAGIPALGESIEAVRRRLMQARYGDDRYEEAQVVLDDYTRWFEGHGPPLEALARQLRGVVG